MVLSILVFWGCDISKQLIQNPLPEKENEKIVAQAAKAYELGTIVTKEEKLKPESEPIEIHISKPSCQVFDDFSGNPNISWKIVNDNVMGGRSLGEAKIKDQTMTLSGSINLNGGGFTSVRAALSENTLEFYDSVVITAKSDGRGYDLTFRDQNQRRLSHRLGLNLPASDSWQEVTIYLADLEPAFFGRRIEAKAFNKSEAREIGIILNDGLGGDYQLIVKEIKFCKK